MPTHTKAKPPRPGSVKNRPTTLNLTPELWEKLKEMERETGARPSVIVRRLLEETIAKQARRKPRKPQPAA